MVPTRRITENPLSLLRDMDQAFNQAWTDLKGGVAAVRGFPVDIREVNDTLVVEAELPGFKKDEIDLSLEQGVLTIEANHSGDSEHTQGDVHLSERRTQHLVRKFSLPSAYDVNQVEASLADGVLTVTLAKREEVKPKKIEVK